MSIQENSAVDEIKTLYSKSIENLLFKSMDDLCQFDANQVRVLIAELWFQDFLPKNKHLDDETTKQVMTMFEQLMSDLETSHHNKQAFVKF